MTTGDFVLVPREKLDAIRDICRTHEAEWETLNEIDTAVTDMLSASPQHIGSPLRGADDAQLREILAEEMDRTGNGSVAEMLRANNYNSTGGEAALAAMKRVAALSPATGGSSIPMGVTDWQPIETAPKDGTAILLLGAQGRQQRVAYYEDDGPGGKDFCWHVEDAGEGFNHNHRWPTHWQPLPAPPSLPKGEGK